MSWSKPELVKKFNKATAHLDLKDMIGFPILENLEPTKTPTEAVMHFWLFVVNIKAGRFEIFDLIRKLEKGSTLEKVAKTMRASLWALWEDHYPDSNIQIQNFSIVDIEPPKQDNNCDCGIYMLTNAEHWNGTLRPAYGPSNIPNIRKILTHNWIKSDFNEEEEDWRDLLHIGKHQKGMA